MQLVRPSVRLTGALAAMIYLDYNATTPLDPACKTAITKAMDVYGNPSSGHALGQVIDSLPVCEGL
jgi:selenocysteine lyase/cysteine desulfurase